MHDHAIAQQGVADRGVGADHALAADAHPRPDHGIGADHRAGPDLGAGADHSARIDGRAKLQARRGVHAGPHRGAARLEQGGRPQRIGKQRSRDLDEGAIRLAHAQHSHVARRAVRVAFRRQAGSGIARRQLIDIFRLVEEDEVVAGGPVKRSRSGDTSTEVGAGARLSLRERGDLAHRQPATPVEEKGLGHAVPTVPPRSIVRKARPRARPERGLRFSGENSTGHKSIARPSRRKWNAR
jgi:hypothetical protein